MHINVSVSAQCWPNVDVSPTLRQHLDKSYHTYISWLAYYVSV